ncbi:MAG: NUDIX hydrolase [Pseudomonadota bacterium]
MKTANYPLQSEDWKISEPRTVFSNPVMQMVASRVRCGRTGKDQDFYRFEFPSWVNIVATTNAGDLVLVRQYRFGTNRVELEIPGGAVNIDEDPLAAGLRELLEETGYAGKNGRIIGKVCPNPAIQSNTCYTILVENAQQVAAPDQDDMEDIKVLTLPREKVDALVISGAIDHGLVLNGLMFFAMEMQRIAGKVQGM